MEQKKPKRVEAEFYRTKAGGQPVREFLQGLPKAQKMAIGTDIRTLEYGWPIGMPVCKSLGSGLWEVRTSMEKQEFRTLFCIHKEKLVLLHAFVKKTQKTPKADLDLAKARRKELK